MLIESQLVFILQISTSKALFLHLYNESTRKPIRSIKNTRLFTSNIKRRNSAFGGRIIWLQQTTNTRLHRETAETAHTSSYKSRQQQWRLEVTFRCCGKEIHLHMSNVSLRFGCFGFFTDDEARINSSCQIDAIMCSMCVIHVRTPNEFHALESFVTVCLKDFGILDSSSAQRPVEASLMKLLNLKHISLLSGNRHGAGLTL